jgi:predicted Ser/Thr protein kinase
MSWPLISDFSRMLQNPPVAFRDLRLRECRIEMDQLGQPRPRSGNFATVYRANLPDGNPLAIKVFNRRTDERRERYRAISEFLERHQQSALVRFEYDDRGIRSASDGKLYPLVAMDWVEGATLFDWARDRSLAGDTAALATAADDWLEVTLELAAAGIVHGDLQHGNVMVARDGRIRLVDYDGMAVPSLMGRTNPEVGLPPYQHPARNQQTLVFPGLDNFSALLIYTALRALAVDPRLWDRHVEARASDKLLFHEHDFVQPLESPLYRDLLALADAEVRGLGYYLFALASAPLHEVPPIADVRLWCRGLDDLLRARDWEAAVQLALRLGPTETVPAQLQPLLSDACRRVYCRRALEQAIAAGDDWEIARNYVPELIDDLPDAAPLIAAARLSLEVVPLLQTLEQLRASGQWRDFAQLWARHAVTLEDRRSAEPYRLEALRLRSVAALRTLLDEPPADPKKLEDAWQSLQSFGGHPSAEELLPQLLPLLDRSRARSRLAALVEHAPPRPLAEHDRQLLAAWNPALLADDPQFALFDEACLAARRRVERLGRLQHWIARPQSTIDSEREIARLAGKLPTGYDPAIADRVQLALRRGLAYDKLLKSLPEPASDVAVAIAWKDLRDCGAQQFVAPRQAARIDLALARLPLLRAMSEELNDSLGSDEYDRRILQIWNERLLEGCQDAEPWRGRFRAAAERRATSAGSRVNGAAHTRTDDDILQAIVAANGRLRRFDEAELRWLAKQERQP